MTMGERVAVMSDGRLQQIDRPQVLYERPANLFVAGFVGSPAMNLVRTRLVAESGELAVELGGKTLRLPRAMLARRPRLGGYAGAELIVGVRPEDIEDATLVPSANGSTLEVRVLLAEAMGAEVIAHFPLVDRADTETGSLVGAEHADAPQLEGSGGEAVLTARLSPRSAARSGEPLRVAVDVERLHFFDPETEEAIW
jgi:multiple sugar transport system ATP-binding protein